MGSRIHLSLIWPPVSDAPAVGIAWRRSSKRMLESAAATMLGLGLEGLVSIPTQQKNRPEAVGEG